MTFPNGGTQNSVLAATGISSANAALYESLIPSTFPLVGVTSASYPASLEHGLNEWFWPDPGLINLVNTIYVQANYTYRI